MVRRLDVLRRFPALYAVLSIRMEDKRWKLFFDACNEILGIGACVASHSNSWCSWTTFRRLNEDCLYWGSGLPASGEYTDNSVVDGGVWSQSFLYKDIAHLIVPKKFYWEIQSEEGFESGCKEQNIVLLSKRLIDLKVPHRLTEITLEIRTY